MINPLVWFANFNLFGSLGLIATGFGLIWFTSRHVISNSIGLAQKLNVSTFLIGSVIAALMTSLPEIVIAISALLQSSPEVSLGNIFGSNLSNMSITLVLPLLFVKKIKIDQNEQESLIFMIFTSVLAMLSILLPAWNRFLLAPLLIIAYFASVVALIKFNRLDNSNLESAMPQAENETSALRMLGNLIISLVATTAAGNLVVFGAKILGAKTGMGMSAIGAAFLTLASTVPEIFVNVAATKENESGFAFGNSIGSLMGQSLLILGLLYGFSSNLDTSTLVYSVPWLGSLSFILAFSLYFFKGINRTAGAALALLYLGFWLQTVKLGLS